MTEQEARQSVADAGRLLLSEKLVARTWGNISCRTGETAFVITPSGLSYEGMQADDVVLYDMCTETWQGTRKPSSERPIHEAAYRQFPEAGFVIHTHQTYASALGLAGFDPQVVSTADWEALGGVAQARYGLPSTGRLHRNVAAALATGAHTVLMAQHGALIVGRNLAETLERSKRLEAVCRGLYRGKECTACGDEATAQRLLQEVWKAYPNASAVTAPAVVETANTVRALHAQLDDMAQMIGTRMPSVAASSAAVLRALRKRDVVLVRGVGAICRADTPGDCHALQVLVEKACVGYLHTRALGVKATLSLADTLLMRLVYLTKYSKKAGDTQSETHA